MSTSTTINPATLLVTFDDGEPPADGERYVIRLHPKGPRGRAAFHGLEIMFERGVHHDVPGALARVLATKREREDAPPGVDLGGFVFQIFRSSADVEAYDHAIAEAENLRRAQFASAETRASSAELQGSARRPIVFNG